MKFIDMFCGIGTIRLGMEQAGHECVYSIEWDKHKRGIYNVIFGNEPEGQDIRECRGAELPRADCWCFGFPCQDISIAGKMLGFRGNRSSLFFEVMRLLSEVEEKNKPKYMFIENVSNLISVNGGWDFFNLLYQMDAAGYDAEWSIQNSSGYVPQNRERTFIIGHLRGECTRKVFPISREVNNKIEKIGDIPKGVMNDNERQRRVYSVEGLAPSLLARSDSPKIICLGLLNFKGSQQVRRVYDINGISPCIDTMQGGHRQPKIVIKKRVRKLTPKECWRLQGIPDEITDKVIAAGISDTQMYRGAGDACTVNVIYEIAKRMA